MLTANEIVEVCDHCGKILKNANQQIWCPLCKVTPYCSDACCERDIQVGRHHRNNERGLCIDRYDARMWKELAATFGITRDIKFTKIGYQTEIMIFPGPITVDTTSDATTTAGPGKHVPHALRHDDDVAQQMLNYAKNQANQAYYVVRVRDLPRVFAELTPAQVTQLVEIGRDAMIKYRTQQASQKK